MSEKFSILKKIDSEILERKINAWNNTHEYLPIILISQDTFNDLDCAVAVVNYDSKYACKFQGCKVFIDPILGYGEVELR